LVGLFRREQCQRANGDLIAAKQHNEAATNALLFGCDYSRDAMFEADRAKRELEGV
jgi:hypothetical protein